jgi:CTP:molybdopterin cytidylyltransferase MocA
MSVEIRQNNDICGLIIAAGYSSRMGRFKPLLKIGNETAIERIINTLKASGLDKILVVTGYNHELLEPLLQKNNVESAYNKDYPKGMFTSITTGISEAINGYGETLRGFLLWPVDCPLIPPRVVKTMLEASEKNQESFIVPCYKGKKGHPLFIPKAYFQAILEHNGEEGLKGVTRPYEGDMIRLETNEEAVVLDMDTPESYEEILRYYEKMISGKKDPEKGNRFRKFVKNFTLFFMKAPVLVVVYSTTYYPSGYHELKFIDAPQEQIDALFVRNPGMQSLGAALENFTLSAIDLGYGSCWLTSANYVAEEIQELLKSEIGFDKEGYFMAAMMALGIPEDNAKSPPKKQVEEIYTFIK